MVLEEHRVDDLSQVQVVGRTNSFVKMMRSHVGCYRQGGGGVFGIPLV